MTTIETSVPKFSRMTNKKKRVKSPTLKQIEEGLYFDFEGFGNNEWIYFY